MTRAFPLIPAEVEAAALRLTGNLARQGYTLDAIHQYTTAQGVPTWWVLRWKNHTTGEKRPMPMRRTDSDFEIKRPEFGPSGAPLYNLHILSNYPEEVVHVVEGESCADALDGVGCIATTFPNGAANVEKTDWSPLAGRWAVLWPDLDAPGFEAMEKARRILRGLGARVVVLDVEAMGLPPKGDAVDWLRLFEERHGPRHLHEIPNGHALAWAEIDALPVKEWKVAA